MIPVSWNEMQCPVSMQKEFRKVAKVQPDYIDYIESFSPFTVLVYLVLIVTFQLIIKQKEYK